MQRSRENKRMDRCSYFIKDRALFGSYPTQEAVEELENLGVRYFVDLTCEGEQGIIPYRTKYNYIRFPIRDRQIPRDWYMFARFIITLGTVLHDPSAPLVYVNCRGGHGRSGIVVATLLCYLFKMTADEALEHTTKAHSKRSVMRDKWRKIGSPQTYQQKNFVHSFFAPLLFNQSYRVGRTTGFSMLSPHPVTTDLGTFPTLEAALHAYKDPNNQEYVQAQQRAKSPLESRRLAMDITPRASWDLVHDDILYQILKNKFDQHPIIRYNLLSTGLRPLVYHVRNDIYGSGDDGKGQNKLGVAIYRLREEYYKAEGYPIRDPIDSIEQVSIPRAYMVE